MQTATFAEPHTPPTTRERRGAFRLQRIAPVIGEFVLRSVACFATYLFLNAAISAYLHAPQRISLLLLIISESLSLGALLLSRQAAMTDWHPLAIASLPVVFWYPLLIDPSPGLRLVPVEASTAIQMVSLVWTIYAKLSLGRSFGLLPANRGIVVRGAYRWVRHPIYLGYIVNHMGFLLGQFRLRNLLVYVLLHAVQIFRILREEKLLSPESSYQNYCHRVGYRLVYGVF